jgi:pimeloyl-ACP methyl ester carboxylesterase
MEIRYAAQVLFGLCGGLSGVLFREGDRSGTISRGALGLRLNQSPSLVIWGWYDRSFLVAEMAAYQRDLLGSEVHILDAGHFAPYEKSDEIAKLVGDFLRRTLSQPAELEQ